MKLAAELDAESESRIVFAVFDHVYGLSRDADLFGKLGLRKTKLFSFFAHFVVHFVPPSIDFCV